MSWRWEVKFNWRNVIGSKSAGVCWHCIEMIAREGVVGKLATHILLQLMWPLTWPLTCWSSSRLGSKHDSWIASSSCVSGRHSSSSSWWESRSSSWLSSTVSRRNSSSLYWSSAMLTGAPTLHPHSIMVGPWCIQWLTGAPTLHPTT